MILDAHGRQMALPDPGDRMDGWQNWQTGVGTAADKTTLGRFFPTWRILDTELRNLNDASDLAAKTVWDRPNEQFREGYDMVGRIPRAKKSGSPTDAADDVPESDARDLREWAAENFELDTNLHEGAGWGRLFGGCLLVLGLNDGGMPWEPLDEDKIRSFDFLSLVDRRYAYVQSQYSGINAKKYGTAQIYLISNAIAGSGWDEHGDVTAKTPEVLRASGAQIQLCHSSRVIRFDGNPADVQSRQRLAGWTWSVLQRVYAAMRQFEHAFDSAGYLLADASQSVFKVMGLMKAISAGNRQYMQNRAMAMEMSRSVIRGIMLDAGDKEGKNAESWERSATPFSGIPDLLDRMMMRFAAAANEPQTKLFGRSPAGMNSTGESDMRLWYDDVRSDANKTIAPKVRRAYRLMGLAKESPIGGKKVNWTIEFKPLWSPTAQETATATAANATRDIAYVNAGVVSPEVVALTLKDIFPAIDTEALEESIEAKTQFDPHENEPPDDPPNLGTGEPLSNAAPIPPIGPGPRTTPPLPGSTPSVATPTGQKTPAPTGPAPKAPPPAGPAPPNRGTGSPAVAAAAKAATGEPKPAGTKPPAKKSDSVETADGWKPREEAGRFAKAEHSEIVGTPHGEAHVQLRVLPNGEHVFSARSRDASGKTTAPMHVRIAPGQATPERLSAEADGKHALIHGHGLPDEVRAQAHALVHALNERAKVLRPAKRDSAWVIDGLEPPTWCYGARVDAEWDEGEHPRESNGQFGSGGGGEKSSEKTGGEGKPSGFPRLTGAFHSIAAALRAAPAAAVKSAVNLVKEKVHEVKDAGLGVKHFLTGVAVSHEEEKAMKKVAWFVASSVIAGHLTPLLHVGMLAHGEVAASVIEKVTDQVVHHVVEKLGGRGLHLDALGVIDEMFVRADASEDEALEWFATQIVKAMPEALEKMSGDGGGPGGAPPPKKDGGERADEFDESNVTRDPKNGQFTSGGDAAAASGEGAPRSERSHNFSDKELDAPGVTQKSGDKRELFEAARQAHEEQLDALDRGTGLDRDLGARLIRGDKGQNIEDKDLHVPGPIVAIGPMKSEKRAQDKVTKDYRDKEGKEHWERVGDLVRSSIAVDSAKDIPGIVDRLRDKGIEIVRGKDRIANPGESGYRDLMMNVKYPSGHVGEIQVHVKSMLAAKSGPGHDLYTQIQGIERAADGRKLTPDERTRVDYLNAQSRAVYEPAWHSARGDAGEWDESQHPRGENGRFGEGAGGPPVGSPERPRLKDDHKLYFKDTPGAQVIPVASLETIRARPTGIANAEHFMRGAAAGTAEKRKPISVEKNATGGYRVLDGNSTVAVARAHDMTHVLAIETPESAHGIKEASPGAFEQGFDRAFKDSTFAGHVTHYTEDQLKGMKLFTNKDGTAGVAVHDHGDGRVEATALYNAGGAKGAGLALLQHAIDRAGVNYVECYGPALNKMYAKLGFKEASRDAFNPAYASKDWDSKRWDSPDYLTMKLGS
jgi:uncharacterized protein